jgi:diguanylate cyclase (GGDEF)-like protein/PAS domain S-box-containing protein
MALLLLGGVIWALVLVWLIADAWYNDRLEEARAREKTEAALRESEQRFRTIFEQSANAVAFGDESGRILLANQAFYDLLGYELGELEGLSFTDLTHPDDLPHEQELLRELLKRGHDHYRLEKRYLAKNGSSVWVDLIVSAVRADDGSPLHFIGVATDIRDKRAAQAELEFRATYDPLTGAVNRLAFEQYLEVEQNRTERYGEPSCLVMFDIDHFKPINDTYGHQAGDGVLATLAQRVQERLRASDILGRWGGEEFMVLLPKTGRPGGLRVAETLRRAVAGTTFPTVGRVTISLGVAELRSDESFTELLMRVDDAMYAAKEGGRNRVARAGEAGAAPQIVDGDERGRPGESRTAPGA